ncbi:MAG: RloB family protein [Bacillota bacterium]
MAKKRNLSPERLPKTLYKGACVGLQEYLYFRHLKGLIRNETQRIQDIDFDFINVKGGSSHEVAKRADRASVGEFEKIAVFDYDGKHIEFINALDLCKEKKIIAGYSNYSFDLWLLLHKQCYTKVVLASDDYAADTKTTFNLAPEADIKSELVIAQLLNQITLADVKTAIAHAVQIVAINHRAIPPYRTNRSAVFFDNPDIALHVFIDEVLKHAGV